MFAELRQQLGGLLAGESDNPRTIAIDLQKLDAS